MSVDVALKSAQYTVLILLQLLHQLGDSLKEVGHQSYIGDLEDGCLGVLRYFK